MIITVELKRVGNGFETVAYKDTGKCCQLYTPGQYGLVGGEKVLAQDVIKARLSLRDFLEDRYEVVAYGHSWKLEDGNNGLEAVLK